MKRIILFMVAALLLSCEWAFAQKETYTITHSGWGRLETGVKVAMTTYETSVSELDIHRWRKTRGELVLDQEGKLLTVRLPRKELTYNLLTDSYVHQTRGGWDYVECMALENDHTLCRVWVCTHEDGTRQILVLYPKFVQGYKIIPVEE